MSRVSVTRVTLVTLLGLLVAALGAGCASNAPAPVDDRRPAPSTLAKPAAAAPAAARPGAGAYVVKRGDTLYSIALEHGVDFRELAQWNRIDDPSKLRIGQELRVAAPVQAQAQAQAQEDRSAVQVGSARISGEVESRPLGPAAGAAPVGAAPSSAAAGQAAAGSLKTSPQALRLPYSEQNLAALSRGEARVEVKPEAKPEPVRAETARVETAKVEAKPEAVRAPVERASDGLDFVWPAKGRVVAGFSEPRNKGVDIAGNLGDPVVAAAAGRVIYVGSGIPGLGKFIVVRHEGGFNTVYAHNRENLVKMDQNLARGQKIAEVGSSDAGSPMLHFQIRKFGTPLDPLRYLP